MVEVKIVNITKRYRKIETVKNVTLEVKDREFFVISGPLGAGKTTLLRMIAGLERPDEGSIYIGDRLVNDVPAKDRDISMVFEDVALYPNKTAFENIAFPLRVRKSPEEEIRKKVHEVSEILLIRHLLDRKPVTFSGGERQRVAIARAIVRRPKVYLMDQPLSDLDAKIRESMRTELRKLARELGQTIIYTTHDSLEAMILGDRIAVINQGSVEQCGTPNELYDSPRNRFVARFIGSPSMNFLKCSLEKKDGNIFLSHEAFRLEAAKLRDGLIGGPDSKIILGIRPEHVSVYFEKTPREAIPASVFLTEPLGSKTIISFNVGKDIVKAVVPGNATEKIGDKRLLEFNRARIHLFDEKTGQRIV